MNYWDVEGLEEFVAGMEPPNAARARKALQTQVRVNGKEFITRGAVIAARIAIGAKVVKLSDGRRVLMSPDGAYFEERDITKTGIDYAVFLKNR